METVVAAPKSGMESWMGWELVSEKEGVGWGKH